MFDLAPQGTERRFDLCRAPRSARFDLFALSQARRAGQVARVGRITKTDSRLIFFLCAREKLREPRRTANKDDQHARRKRIERARVPDSTLAQDAPDSRHHVVRSPTGGFVYDKDAVHKLISDFKFRI